MAKTYYWIQLKTDFFKDKAMKKLRKIAGGEIYTIIYLKLQLLSLKDEGKLYFDGIEDDFATELALEIDEDTENVKFTILYLKKCGLLEEITNEEIFLNAVPSAIGKESESAPRVRAYREKKKQKALQCNSDVTNGNTEIEKEKYIDLKKELNIKKESNIQDDKSSPDLKNTKDNKNKTEKKKEVKIYYPEDELLNQAFLEFIEFRKKIKAPMTDHAIELTIKKLDGMTNENDEKISILNQSIMNGWKGIFPLKDNISSGGNKANESKNYNDTVNRMINEIMEEELSKNGSKEIQELPNFN